MNVRGCFGSPTIYSSTSEVCSKCEGFVMCGDESLKTLARLREEVDVNSLLKRHIEAQKKSREKRAAAAALPPSLKIPVLAPPKKEAVTISAEHHALIESVTNKKARVALVAMCMAGLFDTFIKEVQARTVTIARPLWLISAVKTLCTGPKSRSEIADAVSAALPEWSTGTIEPHVSMALSILTGLSLAEQRPDESYILKGAK